MEITKESNTMNEDNEEINQITVQASVLMREIEKLKIVLESRGSKVKNPVLLRCKLMRCE